MAFDVDAGDVDDVVAGEDAVFLGGAVRDDVVNERVMFFEDEIDADADVGAVEFLVEVAALVGGEYVRIIIEVVNQGAGEFESGPGGPKAGVLSGGG